MEEHRIGTEIGGIRIWIKICILINDNVMYNNNILSVYTLMTVIETTIFSTVFPRVELALVKDIREGSYTLVY
jgi:hypothetical protein